MGFYFVSLGSKVAYTGKRINIHRPPYPLYLGSKMYTYKYIIIIEALKLRAKNMSGPTQNQMHELQKNAISLAVVC